MALGGGEDAGRLAIGLGEMTVGGAGDQPARRFALLHDAQHRRDDIRRRGDELAHGCKIAGSRKLMSGDIEDDAGEKGLGFLVPMGFAGFARRVVNERVGERRSVLGDIEAFGIEPGERIEGGRGQAGHAERIEDMDGAEAVAGATSDAGVLALGVDADDGAIGGEEVGDDGADALAGAGRRHGEEMGRTVITEQLAGVGVAADEQAGVGPGERLDFPLAGEAGGTVRIARQIAEMIDHGSACHSQEHTERDEAGPDIGGAVHPGAFLAGDFHNEGDAKQKDEGDNQRHE